MSGVMKETLHFSVGPVQGFVAESRRTRDLWGSSYLLSFLVGHAMAAVTEGGHGEIELPDVEKDPLLQAIALHTKGQPIPTDRVPTIATLPNRFVARCTSGRVAAEAATRGFNEAWRIVAKGVWEKFFSAHADRGDGTRAIWDRQTNGFWDIEWVVGDGFELLDRRKNWRIHSPPEEGGDKCTVMADWQELSGYVRPRGGRERQLEFWAAVRGKAGALDLREDERLCAIAAIKRFFPRVSKDTLGWDCGQVNWPSTPYMAQLRWLEVATSEEHRDASRAFFEEVKKATKDLDVASEEKTRIRCLIPNRAQGITSLDANYLFPDALKNHRVAPLKCSPKPNDDQEQRERKRLVGKLEDLVKKVGPQSPYYALLLMDGDSMGTLIRDLDNAVGSRAASKALGVFARAVGEIVADHDGVLVYAGGDDVLALLPRDLAVRCARAISAKYTEAFETVIAERGHTPGPWLPLTTISAGLVFTHFKTPLRSVLDEAHHLLDEVAKEANGRASLAVAVYKGSGKNLEWVTTWEHLGTPAMTRIDQLAERMEDKKISSSLLYRLRQEMGRLCGVEVWRAGMFATIPTLFLEKPGGEQAAYAPVEQLVATMIAQSREGQGRTAGDPARGAEDRDDGRVREEDREHARLLVEMGHRASRHGDPPTEHVDRFSFGIDAALLARFIKHGEEDV